LASRTAGERKPRRKRRWTQLIAGRLVETVGGTTTIDGQPVTERAFHTFMRSTRKERDLLWPMAPQMQLR
jgi:hypothetical protein